MCRLSLAIITLRNRHRKYYSLAETLLTLFFVIWGANVVRFVTTSCTYFVDMLAMPVTLHKLGS